MDEYGEERNKNIAARIAWMNNCFQDTDFEILKKRQSIEKRTTPSNDENIENQPPKKRRRLITNDSAPYRSNVRPEFTRKYNTRSANKKKSEGNENNEDENKKQKIRKEQSLKVIFPFAKTYQREIDLEKWDDDDYEDEENSEESDDGDYRSKKRKVIFRVSKSEYDPSTIPSPDEITNEMLKNVAERSSKKVYCKKRGTSCHQCRQKTLDTKTVCRSGQCMGVRGQFCGPCLRGRYGEDAATVLKDPNWICPPCRGLCNCSLCRTRNGQRPTGILAPIAKEEGYQSVMDYLRATSGDELEEDEEDEAEEEEKEIKTVNGDQLKEGTIEENLKITGNDKLEEKEIKREEKEAKAEEEDAEERKEELKDEEEDEKEEENEEIEEEKEEVEDKEEKIKEEEEDEDGEGKE